MVTSLQSSLAADPRGRAAGWARITIVFAGLLLLVILLQALDNAYGSDFSGYPDESAHFVTGLMIRDYIAHGFPHSPIQFAEDYYLHYPKVAFGMWGPLLHVSEGVWTLIFPANRASVLVLMAIITTATATLLYSAIATEFGAGLALFGAILFVAVPNVQTYTGMVMADGLVALLDLCAMLAFARFLDRERWQDALFFGIFATLSILTKGNGIALALLPVFALPISGKWKLILRGSIWVALIPVVLIAAPWQYFSSRMLSSIIQRQPGWIFLPKLTVMVLTAIGWALIPFWAVGIYDRLIAKRRSMSGLWASAAGLIIAFWLFHGLVASAGPEPRYVIAATPPIILFAIAGIYRIATLLPHSAGPRGRRVGTVAAAAALLFATTFFFIPHKVDHGFAQAAARLEQPENNGGVILASSDGDGEGMLISEIAMRDRRPSHIVLRASKMLSQSDWNGAHYVTRYATAAELLQFLDSVPVELVVIDSERGAEPPPHQTQLRQAMAQSGGEWSRVAEFDEPSGSIEIYRSRDAAGRKAGKIRIEMPYTLKRSIER